MRRLEIILILIFISVGTFAQNENENNLSIDYSHPVTYTIEGVNVLNIRYLDKDVIVQISGLTVGQKINIPGDGITNAIKKLWKRQLFSDVKIEADKIVGDKIWLNIFLQEMPHLTDVVYNGVSKSEKDDIQEKVLFLKGSQVTENQLNNAQRIIEDIFHQKGFFNTKVNIVQRDDPKQVNNVIVYVNVDKKEKVKVKDLYFHGIDALNAATLNRAMKKTNAKKLINFFRTKKFLQDKYEEDKKSLVDKYNEKGYRDATIVKDSVTSVGDNRVRVDLWINEGDKYYFGNVKWMGNTVYPSKYLGAVMGIKKGDVFNQKLLSKRLTEDDDAVGNLYLNHGYLFYNLSPVESDIKNDTINYEMRIYEGKQATIDRVIIEGNTKTNEHVARRELRTYPGDLFSKDAIIRSVRELSQLGHFDPEAIVPTPIPHPEDGTVDIKYSLTEKSNDQIELSGGWGSRMFVGTVGLRFSNFSVRNIFNKEAWRPLPTGDGQTLSIKAQTSGKFYNSYSVSFIEPWLGGKKPNSLSVSFSRSRVNYTANNYYNRMSSPYGYGYGSGYGSSYGGYGSSYGGYGTSGSYTSNSETDQIQKTTAVSLGYGYRLSWPDDYFTLYHELSFQHYSLENMSSYYYFLSDDDDSDGDGEFNNVSFKTALSRKSIDNPLFTRSGSSFSLSVKFTLPYSLFNDINYNSSNVSSQERYKWIEFHKWKFSGDWYTPLSQDKKLILRTNFEYGFLGYFDKGRRSPFERFRVGGSGMSGYNLYGSDIVALRGYEDYSLSPTTGSNIYDKYTMELRYPVILKPSSTIYVLSFLEGGNAWMNFDDFDPFDIKRSAGVGVRIYLPMFGLMGIDWGYGFDDINGDSTVGGSQFHFVIGQQF